MSIAERLHPLLPAGAPTVPHVAMSARAVRVTTLAVVMSLALATALGVAGQRSTSALGHVTTLTVIGGDVSVATDGAIFTPAADGDVVRAGATVRTGPSSYALITYFDGSTVTIDPSSSLTVVALGLDPDGTTTISMRQDIGRTWHSVQHLLLGSSRYDVTTPTMTASVRGTMFMVAVAPDDEERTVTTLDTIEGVVAATGAAPAGAPVLVPAGFRVSARRGEPIGPPGRIPANERARTVTTGHASGVVDAGGRLDPGARSNGFVPPASLPEIPTLSGGTRSGPAPHAPATPPVRATDRPGTDPRTVPERTRPGASARP